MAIIAQGLIGRQYPFRAAQLIDIQRQLTVGAVSPDGSKPRAIGRQAAPQPQRAQVTGVLGTPILQQTCRATILTGTGSIVPVCIPSRSQATKAKPYNVLLSPMLPASRTLGRPFFHARCSQAMCRRNGTSPGDGHRRPANHYGPTRTAPAGQCATAAAIGRSSRLLAGRRHRQDREPCWRRRRHGGQEPARRPRCPHVRDSPPRMLNGNATDDRARDRP